MVYARMLICRPLELLHPSAHSDGAAGVAKLGLVLLEEIAAQEQEQLSWYNTDNVCDGRAANYHGEIYLSNGR